MKSYAILKKDTYELNKIDCNSYNENNWHGNYYPNGYLDENNNLLVNDGDGGYQERIYERVHLLDIFRKYGPDHWCYIDDFLFQLKDIHHFSGE